MRDSNEATTVSSSSSSSSASSSSLSISSSHHIIIIDIIISSLFGNVEYVASTIDRTVHKDDDGDDNKECDDNEEIQIIMMLYVAIIQVASLFTKNFIELYAIAT